MIYLDTHVVVWLYQKELERFSPAVLCHLETAPLLISPMVSLELQYLHETGRIREGTDPILRYLRSTIGLAVCSLPFEEVAAVAVAQRWTRDPFDRLITAQAAARRLPLITKDESIRTNYDRAMW